VHELPVGGLNQTFSRPEKHPSSSLLPVSDDAVAKMGYVRNEAISMVESVRLHSYIDMYPCSSQPHIPSQSIVLRFYDLSGFSRSDSRFERHIPRINYMQRVNDTWNEFAMPRLSNDRTIWTIMFSHCRELIRFLPNCFLPPINYGASVSWIFVAWKRSYDAHFILQSTKSGQKHTTSYADKDPTHRRGMESSGRRLLLGVRRGRKDGAH
jgi:hypothetical protein